VSPGPQFGREGSGHVRLNMATSPFMLERIVAAMGGT
jgi:bifunctional pyridoxal-dependent enzyme with beta-cystathionase and maltose regulon repressor activities